MEEMRMMEETRTSSGELVDMISRLDLDDLRSVKKYVAFLLAGDRDKDEGSTVAEKQRALDGLRRHRGILGGADREALRASAMEEKYGRVP